jgi:hypothetical protein
VVGQCIVAGSGPIAALAGGARAAHDRCQNRGGQGMTGGAATVLGIGGLNKIQIQMNSSYFKTFQTLTDPKTAFFKTLQCLTYPKTPFPSPKN